MRVSNGLGPYQDRKNVCPDLGPNLLQRLSADDKICCKQGKSFKLLVYSNFSHQLDITVLLESEVWRK